MCTGLQNRLGGVLFSKNPKQAGWRSGCIDRGIVSGCTWAYLSLTGGGMLKAGYSLAFGFSNNMSTVQLAHITHNRPHTQHDRPRGEPGTDCCAVCWLNCRGWGRGNLPSCNVTVFTFSRIPTHNVNYVNIYE